MGKSQPQLPLNHLQQQQNRHGSSFFVRCSRGFSRTARLFSFKCAFILLLSASVSLSAIFSVVRIHHRQSGYDANDSIKHSAKVQAYFRLEKSVSFLLPQITRLEYDIYNEIGVPGTQVVILSMHESSEYNYTDVVFGVLHKPMNSPINPISLSVLKTSLLDLFSQRSNLTLTKSIFGLTSNFEILKFPNGITIIPRLSPPVWFLPEVLFNFTLRNSLQEIEYNFLVLKEQLNSGLQLMPDESVFLQVTNKVGSTQDPPVTVQASIVSNLGSLDPQRLKQLAQEITGSPPGKNLGLDHSVFGKVKEISLSSFLSRTLDAPTPSPAPSPEQNSPTGAPASSPSPGGSDDDVSPGPRQRGVPPGGSTSLPPNLSPLPAVSYGSVPSHESGLAPSPLPSSSSCGLHSISCYSMHIWWWCWWLTVLVLVT
ncbi:unnamed protein product [Lactuca saligna]|uniref:DUF7036 domain-containing protein n=1 Tax=Lactuca saligna TaxID=75948 RepID=A0AA36A5T8_LACSI|nr:unnamed protein product [Lactuca saligna]